MKHLVLDTSVFVRFLARDIETHFLESKELFVDIEEQMAVGYVSLLTVQELLWILEHSYTIPREEFVPKLITLFSLKNIKFLDIKKSLLLQILSDYKDSTLEFSQLHLVKISEDRQITTFDRSFIKVLG